MSSLPLLFSSVSYCLSFFSTRIPWLMNFEATQPEDDLVPKSCGHRAINHELTPGCPTAIKPYWGLLGSLAIMQTHRDLHPMLLRIRSRTKGKPRDEIWGQRKSKEDDCFLSDQRLMKAGERISPFLNGLPSRIKKTAKSVNYAFIY